jgi:hypothetical protein
MTERRFALIIANNEYEREKDFPPLKAPIEDARQMAEVLSDPHIGGFQVLPLLINKDRAEVESTIEIFFCNDDRQPDDLLLLYFSGHGLKHLPLGNKLFFAVKNSNKSLPIGTAVAASTLNDMMKASPSQKQVLLLDCCYSGAFSREFTRKGNTEVNVRDHFEEGKGKFVLAASGGIEESYEYDRPDKKLSVFTEVLVEGLRSGKADIDMDNEISFEDLWSFIEAEVPARKPGQRPQHLALEAHKKILIAHNPFPRQKLTNEIEAMLNSIDPDIRTFAFQKLIMLSNSVGEYTMIARSRLEEFTRKKDPQLMALLSDKSKQGVLQESSSTQQIPRESHKKMVALLTPQKRTTGGHELYILGDMEFVKIPKGEFIMGSTEKNKLSYGNERPQSKLDIPYDFWMGRYPVTNARYVLFRKFHEFLKSKVNHPVVNVSWDDTLEYIEWLNHQYQSDLPSGFQFILPSEAEWEKAARGEFGNEWPWGNKFDPSLCNSAEGGVKDTTEVGAYSPRGDSPYGCADMCGNVWEWTRSIFKDYPYNLGDGREDLKSTYGRVLRGGSFLNDRGVARCAFRNWYYPNGGGDLIGFRLVIVSPIFTSGL